MAIHAIDGIAPRLPADGSCWIAPTATVIGDVTLGAQTSLWFGTVVRGDIAPIAIGAGSNVQDGSILHADPTFPLTIGADCTIGHRVILHGCTVGDRVLVGMGAIVLNGAVIGDDCLIGAGALVTEGKTFPPASLIVGAPARAMRPLRAEELAGLKASAARYVANARRYAAGLELRG